MVSPRPHEFIRFVHSTLQDFNDRFIRSRMWCPRSVFIAVLLLTRARRRTTYRELMNSILSDAAGFLNWDHHPSIASLSQARGKLTAESCRTVLRLLTERLGKMMPKRNSHFSGRRFIALDGVRLMAPRSADTLKHFNKTKYTRWLSSHYPQALCVVAVDVFRRLPLDFVLLPKGRGERLGAQQLAEHFHAGDVAIMDRGFPARWLLKEFLDRKIDVVVRMMAGKFGAWPEVTNFLKSGKKSAVVAIKIEGDLTVSMRLIRRNFRCGRPKRGQKAETMVIMTTLMAKDGFDRDALIKLYGARWGIESLFRDMKCEFSIERFHSESVNGIQQEIAAVLAWIAFASAIQLFAENNLPEGRRVLRTLCFVEATKIMEAILAKTKDLSAIINQAIENVASYHYAPKPGRSFPRVCKSPYGRFRVR